MRVRLLSLTLAAGLMSAAASADISDDAPLTRPSDASGVAFRGVNLRDFRVKLLHRLAMRTGGIGMVVMRAWQVVRGFAAKSSQLSRTGITWLMEKVGPRRSRIVAYWPAMLSCALAVGVLLVIAFQFLSSYHLISTVVNNDTELARRGLFGDSFGWVNALFSGLAFVAIIASLLLQRQDLKISIDELRESTRSQRQLASAALKERYDRSFDLFRLFDDDKMRNVREICWVAFPLWFKSHQFRQSVISHAETAPTHVDTLISAYEKFKGNANWFEERREPENDQNKAELYELLAIYTLAGFFAHLGRYLTMELISLRERFIDDWSRLSAQGSTERKAYIRREHDVLVRSLLSTNMYYPDWRPLILSFIREVELYRTSVDSELPGYIEGVRMLDAILFENDLSADDHRMKGFLIGGKSIDFGVFHDDPKFVWLYDLRKDPERHAT